MLLGIQIDGWSYQRMQI